MLPKHLHMIRPQKCTQLFLFPMVIEFGFTLQLQALAFRKKVFFSTRKVCVVMVLPLEGGVFCMCVLYGVCLEFLSSRVIHFDKKSMYVLRFENYFENFSLQHSFGLHAMPHHQISSDTYLFSKYQEQNQMSCQKVYDGPSDTQKIPASIV